MSGTMAPRRTRVLLLASVAVAAGAAGCGGGDGDAAAPEGSRAATADATVALRDVRPISSATVDGRLAISLQDPPAEVGSAPISFTFRGPLAANGSSLQRFAFDVAFSGFGTRAGSRVLSTGDNLFLRVGGEQFQVGQETVGAINAQGEQANGGGLAGIGVDPLAAVQSATQRGTKEVGGVTTTHFEGTLSVAKLLEQGQRLASASGAAGSLTEAQRSAAQKAFATPPRFSVDLGPDRTIRALQVRAPFTTPPENQQAAGGIKGGTVTYSAIYTNVGRPITVTPPRSAEPIGALVTALQQQLARRSGG